MTSNAGAAQPMTVSKNKSGGPLWPDRMKPAESFRNEWRVNLHDRGGVADQRDIAMLWKALGVVTTILLLVLAAVLRRLL